jgi:hypothetical protein
VITDEHGCFQICGWTLLAPIFTVSVAPPEFRPTTSAPHAVGHAGVLLVTGTISLEAIR